MVCQVYRQRPVGLLGLAAFGNDLPPDFPPETEVVLDLNSSPASFAFINQAFPLCDFKYFLPAFYVVWMMSPVRGFSGRVRFNLVSDSGFWANQLAASGNRMWIFCQNLILGLLLWLFEDLCAFFLEMKVCYVGGRLGFDVVSKLGIWANQLATSGNGRWDYFPDLTLLGVLLVFLDWSTFSEKRKGVLW